MRQFVPALFPGVNISEMSSSLHHTLLLALLSLELRLNPAQFCLCLVEPYLKTAVLSFKKSLHCLCSNVFYILSALSLLKCLSSSRRSPVEEQTGRLRLLHCNLNGREEKRNINCIDLQFSLSCI